MTKILIDRSTVEQALEALELYVPKEDYENKPVGNVMDALVAALAEPQRRKTGKPRNATTRLGVVCFEAYARSYVGSNRWDIAAEAVRAALVQPNTAQQVVDEQAEDEALWFVAQTAPEAYLQQALRRLHAAVEGAARAAIAKAEEA